MTFPTSTTQIPQIRLGRRHGIIPALDVPHTKQIRDVVAATAKVDGVVGYKLGPIAVLESGLAAALRLVGEITDLPVIYDHQKAGLDIPGNAEVFARTLAAHGVAGAILFPLAGPTAAARFVSALHEHGVSALVGGQLPVDDYSVSGGGWVVDDALDGIVDVAVAHGETQLIVPAGGKLDSIVARAARAGVRPRLFTPGIGAAGDELNALAGIIDRVSGVYPIVGRAVVGADDPGYAAARLVAALDEVVASAGGIR